MRGFHLSCRSGGIKGEIKVALQFILGGAGSGKTRYLYDQVIKESMAHPELSYLVIAPEQFTMQTQKEIIRLHPRHGVMNIDILSFKRLAYRVFEDVGVRLPVILDDMGKSMVLRKVAGMKKGQLGMFKRHLEQAGFISQLKSQISELYQYGITPDMLGNVTREVKEPLLSQKLLDLEVIYRSFGEYIQERYVTAEELLDILCRELPRWEKLKDSVILLDGFTGFTPVQYRLVELFMIYARDVLCSVTVDTRVNPYRESGIQHLFYMSKHTVCRLSELGRRQGVEKKEDVVCDSRPAWRFRESPELDFLEQNLYRYGRAVWEKPSASVQVYKGRRPSEEADYVCSQIQKMVREEGLRYRDAAVITGDLLVYGRELAHAFDQAEIPYFLDDKKSILENPLVELIRAALEAVRDMSYEGVFRYLKTGLVYDRKDRTDQWDNIRANTEGFGDSDVLGASAHKEPVFDGSREQVEQMTNRMENYIRALGIRGWKNWDCTWERRCRGSERLNLKELNGYRQWVMEPLRTLRMAFKAEGATVASVTKALRTYLEELSLKEKMEDYKEYFLQRKEPGDENLAKEYGQVYDRVMELFERLEGLLGDEKTDMKNYAQILDAGFEEIKVGVIPATIDQVMVGDITRSRLEAVKVLFFVGVNEGMVPQRKSKGSLLTDRDRAVFKSMNLELAPTAKEDGCIQKFYLYLMMAKPSHRLILTYAAMTCDGKSQRPSSLLGEIHKLFPQMETLDETKVERPVRTLRDGVELLIRELHHMRESREKTDKARPKAALSEPAFLELCRYFLSHESCKEKGRMLVEGAFYSYEERGIGRAAARALYGQNLQGSVTRLEQFASCAYAHFLKYGLELLERQEYELEAVDMGNLFHQSIDRCFAVMKEEGRDWRELSQETRRKLVRDCVTQVTEEYGNTIMGSSARNSYLSGRVERITDRTIWALSEQVKKGDFVPAEFELSFSAIDNLKAMGIRLSEDEALWLKGRIDRLDLFEDEGHVYVKIIDYKSGTTTFDIGALYYGLQLQLVVYMDAAMEIEAKKHPEKEVVPAGIFYYHIQDPVAEGQEGITPEDIEKQILKRLRMNGLVNSGLDIIHHLDREIERESDVIPVAVKDGYVQESRSSVASTRQFEALRKFVKRKLRSAGQEILKGTMGTKPYKQGNQTACDFCPYHAICGFDSRTAGYGYRRLKGMKPEEIWAEIDQEREDETDGSDMD